MNKFEEEIEEIKNKIHVEDLSEDFKEKLELNLSIEYNSEKKKNTKKHYYGFVPKAAAAFICIGVVSGCVFADEIQNTFKMMLANSNKDLVSQYEAGNFKEIDTDYQEYNGIALKVNNITFSKDELCITFDLKSEKEADGFNILDVNIEDENGNNICTTNEKSPNLRKYSILYNRIDTNNATVILNLFKSKDIIGLEGNFRISTNKVEIQKNGVKEIIDGNWSFDVNIKK